MAGRDLDLAYLSRRFDHRENAIPCFSSNIRQDTVLLKGNCSYQRLRSGFTLHTSDATEVFDLEARTEIKPGLTFLYFSHGEVDAKFGEKDFHFTGMESRSDSPKTFIVNRLEPDLFLRRTKTGSHTRKMVITVSPEWLDIDGLPALGQTNALRNFLHEHLACAHAVPSLKLQSLVEQIIQAPEMPTFILNLYMESRAIEIVAEMLSAISQQDNYNTGLNFLQQRSLKKAIDFIQDNLETIQSMYEISDYLKTSPSSLQRLFRKAMGCSVFDHIRSCRMKRALTALETSSISVTQAAYIAGYANPASFATAFRKAFGVSPSQVRKSPYS